MSSLDKGIEHLDKVIAEQRIPLRKQLEQNNNGKCLDAAEFGHEILFCHCADDFFNLVMKTGGGSSQGKFQQLLLFTLYEISAVGEKGNLSSALDRIKETFPNNFATTPYKYGKQDSIRKSIPTQERYHEAVRLVVEEKLTGYIACKRLKISYQNYTKYVNKMFSPIFKGQTLEQISKEYSKEEYLYDRIKLGLMK
ncbi:MAG: hypothetical protein QM504_17445 [Pseudomonadota bacterium]